MQTRLARITLLFILIGILLPVATANSKTFTYTGSKQTWDVPSGVDTANFTVNGPGGGGGSDASGGDGGYVNATIDVSGYDSVDLYVAGGGEGTSDGSSGSGGWGLVDGQQPQDGSDDYTGTGGGLSAVVDPDGNVLLKAGGGGGSDDGTSNGGNGADWDSGQTDGSPVGGSRGDPPSDGDGAALDGSATDVTTIQGGGANGGSSGEPGTNGSDGQITVEWQKSLTLTIYSPENTTYGTEDVDLDVAASDSVDTWKYSLDGGSNTTFTPNTTITGLSWDQHNVTVYAEFTDGTNGSQEVSFATDFSQLEIAAFDTSLLTPLWGTTFTVSANVTCAAHTGSDSNAECGTVSGALQYADFDNTPDTLVSTTTGATPFYIPEEDTADTESWSTAHASAPDCSTHSYSDGSGTESDPYVVMDDHDLQCMNQSLSAHYVLGQNINASQTDQWDSGNGFTPVGVTSDGSCTGDWCGVFDGNGSTITGLYIDRPTTVGVGLFGIARREDVRVTNVTLLDATITGDDFVGSVIGGWSGGSNTANISAITLDASNVTGANRVGGVIGTIADESIGDQLTVIDTVVNGQGTWDNGDGTPQNIGGVVGLGDGAILKNIRVENTSVYASDRRYVAGVCGSESDSGLTGTFTNVTVDDVYVSGSSDVGGVIGLFQDGNVTRGEVLNSEIVSSGTNNAGLIGTPQGNGEVTIEYSVVKNTNVSTSGAATAAGLAGYVNLPFTLNNSRVVGGNFTAPDQVGGAVGYLNHGSAVVDDVYAAADTLKATNTDADPGGLVGWYGDGNISGYWDTERSGVSVGVGDTADSNFNVEGLTTSQMQGSEAETNMDNLIFAGSLAKAGENASWLARDAAGRLFVVDDYPVLWWEVDTNTLDCPQSNLVNGQTCSLSWTVNATENGSFNMGVNFSSDRDWIDWNLTDSKQVNVTPLCTHFLDGTNWVITKDCGINSTVNAPEDVEVKNNAVATIFRNGKFEINFQNYRLWIRQGAGILLKHGGKLLQD